MQKDTITILSLRIYKRIREELNLTPILIKENNFNPKFYVWIFNYDKRIEDILIEEKNKKNKGD